MTSTNRPGAGSTSARSRAVRAPRAGRPAGRSDSGPSGRVGASRPALSARPKDATPDVRKQSAWLRWTVLAIVGIAVLITLVPTARSLARQRAEITALEAQVAQSKTDVAALQAETEKWGDPAYIEQQARERLKFVKPGDKSYTVIDPAAKTSAPSTKVVVAAPRADASAPWYGRMWQSVRIADQPAAGVPGGSTATP